MSSSNSALLFRRHPRTLRTVLQLLAGVLVMLLVLPAAAKPPTNPGKWTSSVTMHPSDSRPDEQIAVHLALLRGDMNIHRRYHSQVLWFAFGGGIFVDFFNGGLWSWNPVSDSCALSLSQNLVDVPISAPPKNTFCSAHTHLADGNLFIVGGHDGNDTGTRGATIFDRATRSWVAADSMSQRRWYGSATTMPTGKVLATSGDMYRHMVIYGGHENNGTTLRNKVDRLRMLPHGEWDTSLDSTPPWPTRRENHSIASVDGGAKIIFGGQQTDGAMRRDAWVLDRVDSDNDQTYAWNEATLATTSQQPDKRILPVSIARVDTNGASHPTLYVYGGKDEGGAVLKDLRKLAYIRSSHNWFWSQVDTQGTGPADGLYGASSVLLADSTWLIYGGKDDLGTLSSDVWTLSFRNYKPIWRKALVRASGSPPSARYLHAMTMQQQLQGRSDGHAWTRVLMFGGDTGSLSSQLWTLWVKAAPDTSTADSVEWQQLSPSGTAPVARKQPVMAFDNASSWLNIFGGDTGGSPDTAQWIIDFSVSPVWLRGALNHFSLTGAVGCWDDRPLAALTPELYDPAGSSPRWSDLSAQKLLLLYPFTFVDTTGKVFIAGPTTNQWQTWMFNPAGPSWSQFPADTSQLDGGSAVMYRPGKVMKCGSKFVYDTTGATGLTKWIDLDAGSPAWANSINSMKGRTNHNLNVLPSGEVLVNGGTLRLDVSPLSAKLPVNRPEIWDPDSVISGVRGIWYGNGAAPDTLASSSVPRDYHSTSILLPDGRILCAGGNEDEVSRRRADIYCPPYLFTSSSVGAVRPRLPGVQEAIAYNQNFIVSSPDSILRAVLIKPGAVTHTFNMDQRWVPLARISGNSPCITFKAPADSNIAPPGDYMLFVIDTSGVPSIAEWVRLDHSQTSYSTCDTDPPATITDIGLSCLLHNQATIEWTAPEQNGTGSGTGAATLYDMRVRDGGTLSTIDEFLDEGEPIELSDPQSPGSTETVSISLTPGHTYHVRIMSRDYAGSYRNWSNMSTDLAFEAPTDPYDECIYDGPMAGGGGDGGSSMRIARTSASVERAGSGAYENSLFRGVAIGEATVDALKLPGVVSGETYRARLRESGSNRANVDRVRLLLSDHASGSEARWAGGRLLVGAPGTPAQIKLENLDVGASLATGPLSVVPGQTMEITLDAEGGQAERALLVDWRGLETAVPESTGAQVESKGQDGTWHPLSWISPRKEFDCSAIDSIDGNDLRLRFKTNAQIQSIRTLTLTALDNQTRWISPLDASDNRGDDITARVSNADTASVELGSTDTLSVAFEIPAFSDSLQRDAFLVVDGTRLARSVVNPTKQLATSDLPLAFALRQNEPNPFNGRTAIHFDVPQSSRVRIDIFDVQGRKVATPANGLFPAGRHVVEWDRQGNGVRYSAGVFFYRMQAGSYHARRTMVLLP